MTAPKTLSAEDYANVWSRNRPDSNVGRSLLENLHIGLTTLADGFLKERRRAEELEKEVASYKKCIASWKQEELYWNKEISEKRQERDAAIERAEKADSEVEVFSRYAEKFGDLSCCYDTDDVTAVIDGAFENQKEERDQALALAKQLRALHEHVVGWFEACGDDLECRMDEDCDHCVLFQTVEDIKKALSASPTSLLERFKAEQKILDLCRKFRDEMDRDGASGVADEIFDALAELEKLK